MKSSVNITLFALLTVVIAFYFTYGAIHFIGLNSDHAIHILMADTFRLPRDLYFWGQDRLGSLIPLLGYFLHLTGMSAIMATSIAQILLLATASLLLGNFLKTSLSRILLLLVIFFPAGLFFEQVMVGHPYIAHTAFMSLLVFVLVWDKANPTARFIFLPLIIIGGLWSSEMFVANLPALLLLAPPKFRSWKRKQTTYGSLATLAGLAFLVIAKSAAIHIGTFEHFFASLDEVLQAIQILFHRIFENLTLSTYDPVGSASFLLASIAAVLYILKWFKHGVSTLSQYFFFSAFISFGLIICSNWSAEMNYPVRYFIMVVLQLYLALIFGFDRRKSSVLSILVLSLAVFLYSASGFYRMYKFGYLVDYRMTAAQARDFASFNNIGVIGSYWNSYLIEAFNTEGIDATTHDQDHFRNRESLTTIFTRDSIMLIGLGWRNDFPDTLNQFGARLLRSLVVDTLHSSPYAFYHISEALQDFYAPSQLRIIGGEKVQSGILFTPDSFTGVSYAVYGPYATLPAGTYEVCFDLKVIEAWEGRDPFVEVVNKAGRNLIAQQHLSNNGSSNHCLTFHADEILTTVEFRLQYFGSGKIQFSGVKVIQKKPE